MSNSNTCPACQNPSCKHFGHKNNFKLYICSNCKTLYTLAEEGTQSFDYDEYYDENNILPSLPESINEIDRLTNHLKKYMKAEILEMMENRGLKNIILSDMSFRVR